MTEQGAAKTRPQLEEIYPPNQSPEVVNYQAQMAADAIIEIRRSADRNQTRFCEMLAACDGFDPSVQYPPEIDGKYRAAFRDLYTTFGLFAPIIRQFWQGAAPQESPAK